MKFEGPTPETETRQVSISFAAFIVVIAFVLFGIAMAMGSITSLRTPGAPQQQPETTAPEEGFESPPAPAPLPAVTQPDPTAVIEPDPADEAGNESAAAPEAEQPAPAPAPAPAMVQPVAAAAAPAPRSAAGTPPADTHDASFPTHHTAPPAPAAATPPAPTRSY